MFISSLVNLTKARLKLKRHNLHQKQKEIGRRTELLVAVIPGGICPYCAWQCSNRHHKPGRTAWNAHPAAEEGVCGVWRALTAPVSAGYLMSTPTSEKSWNPGPRSGQPWGCQISSNLWLQGWKKGASLQWRILDRRVRKLNLEVALMKSCLDAVLKTTLLRSVLKNVVYRCGFLPLQIPRCSARVK